MRLRTTLILLVFALPIFGQTQSYKHYTFWYRGILNAPLSKDWDFNAEYQHKQQNEVGSYNLFSHRYLDQIRLWGYLKKGNCTIQFNPFTLISTTPFLGKMADYNLKPNLELRFAAGAEWKQTAQKFTFKERAQYEYRLLRSLNYVGTARTRIKGMLQYALTNKVKLTLTEEFLFNVPPRHVENRFDQNWAYFSIGRQITQKLNVEMGYRRNIKERKTLTEFDDETGFDISTSLKF